MGTMPATPEVACGFLLPDIEKVCTSFSQAHWVSMCSCILRLFLYSAAVIRPTVCPSVSAVPAVCSGADGEEHKSLPSGAGIQPAIALFSSALLARIIFPCSSSFTQAPTEVALAFAHHYSSPLSGVSWLPIVVNSCSGAWPLRPYPASSSTPMPSMGPLHLQPGAPSYHSTDGASPLGFPPLHSLPVGAC